jgi:hypothetical protein
MRSKLAGLSLIVVFAVAAVMVWATQPSSTSQAQPIPEATLGISPHELQQRIAINLPVQETADLIRTVE